MPALIFIELYNIKVKYVFTTVEYSFSFVE